MQQWLFIIMVVTMSILLCPPLTRRGRKKAALMHAFSTNDFERIKIIVDGSFNLNFVKRGHSPLCLAVARNNRALVELFLEHGASPKARGNEALLTCAARIGNRDFIDMALTAGHDIHFRPHLYSTPLETALHRNNVEIARYLVSKGASKEDLRSISWARSGAETIKLLLELGVDVPHEVTEAVSKGEWDTPLRS